MTYAGKERQVKNHIQGTKRLYSSAGHYVDDMRSIAPLLYNPPICRHLHLHRSPGSISIVRSR